MKFKRTKIFPFEFLKYERDFHRITFDELKKRFNTDFKTGLTTNIANTLLEKNGRNQIPLSYSCLYGAIFRSLFSGFSGLLWLASIMSLLAYKPLSSPPNPTYLTLGILIIIVILIQSFFISLQDWSSFKTMKSIQSLVDIKATVVRDGTCKKVSSTDLVIGDLVLLSCNNKVPADVRLIEVKGLRLDKSLLTGESEQIETTTEKCKNIDNKLEYFEANNMAFMTCAITSGTGKGIVVSTGNDTLISRISYLTNSKISRKQTLLQKELNKFSLSLIIFCSIAVLIYICVWLAWLRTNFNSSLKCFVLNILVIIISGIPFGLPITLTLALIIDSKKLKKCKILVKNVNAIETLSSVNVIASDKTGTLTQNKVHAVSVLLGLKEIDLDSCYYDTAVYIGVDKSILELLAICYLGNNFNVKNGNSIDLALFNFSDKNLKLPKLEKCYKLVEEIEFSSKNKYHVKLLKPIDISTHNKLFSYSNNKTHLVTNQKDLNVLIVKGAPDILMSKCKWIIEPEGHQAMLNGEIFERLRNVQAKWSNLGRRVILLCKKVLNYRELENSNKCDFEKYFKQSCNDLCIVGMIGLIDPPRENLRDVIEKLRNAGIRILMCTGDYSLTAASIASQIGILSNLKYDTLMKLRGQNKKVNSSLPKPEQIKPSNLNDKKFSGSIVLSGRDIDLLTKDEWKLICNKYEEIILARSTPDHKLRCIKEFQLNGFIVGMTGDGLNDAPALKNADIGIAMGSGTEAAMQAADIILLDNSFSYIVTSIENGRLLYNNIRKILLYLLPACVFTQIVSCLLNIMLGLPMVLSSCEMLMICIVTDILPSMCLIFEKSEENLLDRPPRNSNEYLVDSRLLIQAFLFLGPMMAIFSHLNYFLYFKWYGDLDFTQLFFLFDKFGKLSEFRSKESEYFLNLLKGAQTSAFISLLIMQSFGNLFATRTRYLSLFQTFPLVKKFRNISLFFSLFVCIIFILIVVHVPIFNDLFETRPVNFVFYALSVAYAFFIIIADETRKYLVRRGTIPKSIAW